MRNSSTQPTDSNDPQLVAVHRPPNNTNSQSSAPPEDSSRAPQATNPQDQARPAQRHRTLPADPKALPLAYEHCAVSDMVVLIAHMLSELIETNDGLALRSDYLNRLAHHATLSPPLLLSMVYYIDRLCALYPEFTINTLTVHRFLITAATVAAKGLSDSFWNNATYAKVGGVRVAELKLLELEFLYRVDWRIVPNPDVLVAYYKGLVERCPGYALESSTVNSPLENNCPDSLATVAANGEASNAPAESPKGQNGDS
ncbi:unnamed protein product [Parascedosporium putredinis]|uniref:Nuc-1 negative regulatory protein preg n=1 Tax=Parascedosporium putredinis TaxID=1442378 RepID=A0A9P1H755_9PEZI|nr:unnamed protein product [Parascedosporium putredinis]CAI7999519.1 unnamed protein product [Parascedosporium putredinis]